MPSRPNMLIKTGHRADEYLSASGSGTVEDPYLINTVGGKGISLDAWGKQKITVDVSLFHSLFTFDVPSSLWIFMENGVEVSSPVAATSVGAALNLSSNGNNASLISRRHPRYQPNRGQLWSASMILPDKTGLGQRDFGLFTDENGVFYRLKSDGNLYAVLVRGGVQILEELITLPDGFDVEKGNIYDIQMQWRGVGDVKFYIGDPVSRVPVLVHTFDLLNTLTTLSTEEAAMCIAFKSTNQGEDVVLQCGCVDLTSEGGGIDREQYASAYNENISAGSDVPILAIHQPGTINSKFNSRDIRLARITGSSDKKVTFKVWVTRDPTAFTGATFAKLDNGSYVETDSPLVSTGAVKATAVDLAKCKFVTAFKVEANSSMAVENPSRDTIDFFLVHGDYLVVTCTGSGASNDVVIEWGEEI